jgi:hypothetical protein
MYRLICLLWLKQPKSEQTEENTTQYVDFLFETAKILPATAKDLRGLLNEVPSDSAGTSKG